MWQNPDYVNNPMSPKEVVHAHDCDILSFCFHWLRRLLYFADYTSHWEMEEGKKNMQEQKTTSTQF